MSLRLGLAIVGLIGSAGGGPELAAAVGGPEHYITRTWTTDDGLPHNDVNHVLQDGRGYIWLGTAGGLARFDGHAFRAFPLPPEMSRQGNNIRGLQQDGPDLLLLLPNDTLVRFDGASFILHPMNAGLKGRTLTDLFVGSDHSVWVGCKDGTLFHWRDGRLESFGKADGISRRLTAFSFAADVDGKTWIATGDYLGSYRDGRLERCPFPLGRSLLVATAASGGIWILSDSRLFRLENGRLEDVPAEPSRLPPNALPHALLESPPSSVWIATTNQGLFRLSGGRLEHLPNLSDSARFLFRDREGDVWVGTDGRGLSLLEPKCFSLLTADVGSGPNVSRSLCADEAGEVWMVDRKGRLVRRNGDAFEAAADLGIPAVNCVCPADAGALWVGAKDGLYRWTPGTPTPARVATAFQDIRSLFPARDGTLWFADRFGRIGAVPSSPGASLQPHNSDGEDRAAYLAEDADGGIWCGTNRGELSRYSGGSWHPLSLPAPFTAAPIHALLLDHTGALWIGRSDGLLLWQGGEFRRLTEADGLPDAMILQIAEDNLGYLWFASRRGLYRVSQRQLLARADRKGPRVEATILNRLDGLPRLSFRTGGQPISGRDPDGVLWFASDSGALAITPSALTLPPAHIPVAIEQPALDGRPIAATPFRISSGRHRIEIPFAGLSYRAPDRIRLWHQLVGVDPAWIESGKADTADYSSLPPGAYRFRVLAGEKPELDAASESDLDFQVMPAWWQTWWFRVPAIAGLAALAAGGVSKLSRRKLKRRLAEAERACRLERERARIARDLHDELGGSLTRIGFALDRLRRQLSQPEQLSLAEHLGRIVRRHSADLRRVVWTASPKNHTADQLVTFLGRYAQTFFVDSPITCIVRPAGEISARPTAPDAQHHILATVKESLSNVLRHSHATTVIVEARECDECLEISVQDDGVGFDPAAAGDDEHFGLANMRSRMAELGGFLELRSRPGTGTAVLIRVAPWARAAAAAGSPPSTSSDP